VQLRFPTAGGANLPLIIAQPNFQRFGAIEERYKEFVRPPATEQRDEGWRLLDTARDDFEVPEGARYFDLVQGLPLKDHNGLLVVDTSQQAGPYATTYPDDLTTLYYWRPTFWRRQDPK
jgi:hypothetical protein